jgi:CBS domain-containing protein
LGALPVAENERLIGMLTDRDIVVRVVAEGKNVTTPVRQILTEKILYCFEDEPIEEAAENMSKNQVHRLSVLNRDKRLVGTILLGDLALQGGSGKSAEALRGVLKPTY